MRRPLLRKGDMVRINRKNPPAQLPSFFGNVPGDMDTMFMVVEISADSLEAHKLRVLLPRRRVLPSLVSGTKVGWSYSTEGFADITIMSKEGILYVVKRRHLWKIPDASQPRNRKPSPVEAGLTVAWDAEAERLRLYRMIHRT